MAFFENLGQRISRSSQEALQKTKDMAQTVSLSNEINDHKHTIEYLQMEIGGMIIKDAFSDTSIEKILKIMDENQKEFYSIEVKDWKSLLKKVIELKAEEGAIDEAQDQIAKLRGGDICPSCGAEIDKHAQFCSHCGMKLERSQKEEIASEEGTSDAAIKDADKISGEASLKAASAEPSEEIVQETLKEKNPEERIVETTESAQGVSEKSEEVHRETPETAVPKAEMETSETAAAEEALSEAIHASADRWADFKRKS